MRKFGDFFGLFDTHTHTHLEKDQLLLVLLYRPYSITQEVLRMQMNLK